MIGHQAQRAAALIGGGGEEDRAGDQSREGVIADADHLGRDAPGVQPPRDLLEPDGVGTPVCASYGWGTPRDFDFTPVEHFEIAGVRGGMDFATAAKLSGARFVVLSGAVARIHRALAQFMLDLHVDRHGLTETWTPVLVLPEMMEGTGQLPKFGEDSYQTREGWWLIPTSEVTLTNTVHGDLVDHASLSRRMVAHSQ